jgi:hypothetical protein
MTDMQQLHYNPTLLTAADLRGSEQPYRATTLQDLAIDHAHYANMAAIQQSDYLVIGNRIPPRTVDSAPMRPLWNTTREHRLEYVSEAQSNDSLNYTPRTVDSRRGLYVDSAGTSFRHSRFKAF